MKRTLRIALALVVGIAFAAPAIAQDAFPDTPENHWAYEALREMKANGLLVGYPDGLFRGPRPASRYELAVAIHATFKHLKSIADGIDGRIQSLKGMLDDVKPPAAQGGGATQADIDNLKRALSALQGQADSMKGWGDDIANLKRLARTFERELSTMGVDVEMLKRQLGDLGDRVTALEDRKLPVDIHGDISFLGIGGYSVDGLYGLTVDSRPTGVGAGSYSGQPSGLTRDVSLLHEAAISLGSTNETGPTWGTTVVVGSMLESLGDQAWVVPGNPFQDDVRSDVYVQNAHVRFDTSLVGLDFTATVGRVGYEMGPFFFQRVDNTPYFRNERWDNHQWSFDGAILGFEFGKAKLDVFGGRNSARGSLNGIEIQPMMAGNVTGAGFTPGGPRPRGMATGMDIPIDRSLGAHLEVPLSSSGELNLAYLFLDSDTSSSTAGGLVNGVNVFGGDARLWIKDIVIEGGYSQSDVRYNSTTVVNDDNAAWWVKAALAGSKWGVNGWYRKIEPLFAAPGDWGRIGDWWNPTDVKGYGLGGHFDLSDRVRLMGSAEMYKGAGTASSALTDDDKVDRYLLGLGYKINGSWQLGVGYETVRWSLGAPYDSAKPTETWWNVGLGYAMNNQTSVNILWQISDFDGKGVAGFTPFGLSGDRAKGGLITTQLSVRF